MLGNRTVIIKKLPAALDIAKSRLFLRELESYIRVSRPCVVLDCSSVMQLERIAVCLLLSCLEAAMKWNGDVRLAGLGPEAREALATFGAGQLFMIFDSNNEAVESFHLRPVHAPVGKPAQGMSSRAA
ncbi:MAG TPA: STAS domain-containing protein [Terracidiphilus sp.]|nr:STAS domain-containing protein [Terracidiphilus sp.]